MRSRAVLLLLAGLLIFAVACGGGNKEQDTVKKAVESGIKALLTFNIDEAHKYWSDDAIIGVTEGQTAEAGLSRLQSLAAIWELKGVRNIAINGSQAQATADIRSVQRPSGTTRGIVEVKLVHNYGLTQTDGRWKITSASK